MAGTVLDLYDWRGLTTRVVKFTFDSSYATGGESLTAGDFRLDSLILVHAEPVDGYVFAYDYTNSKLKAFRQKDPGAAGGADIALPEVAATTDLSAVATRVFAIGVDT